MHRSLEDIGVFEGTDKSSLAHDYLHFYEFFLEKLRDKSFFLFEIGIYEGDSLRMWSTYFRQATIVGLDINPEAANKKMLPNAHVRIGDAESDAVLNSILTEFGDPLIIIDDGSHQWHHQIKSLRMLWPSLQPGGFFIMEDIHTSFQDLAELYKGHSSITCYDYLLELNKWVVGNRFMTGISSDDTFIKLNWSTVESMSFYRGTCILKKKAN